MFTKRERVILLISLLSWLIVPVAAQMRPGLFSTLITTDTTVNSLLVGGTPGSTTGAGGIKSGPIVATVNNLVSTGMGARFNASNPMMGIGIANSNGFPYLGFNTVAQVSSDTPKYDITGFAGQFRMDNGSFKFLTAPSGTAGNAITLTERWGINNAGDFTFGASSHIFASAGTPSITSGAGTSPSIAGIDSAFKIVEGTPTGGTVIVVAFGHTFDNAPSCSLSNAIASAPNNASSTTTQVSLAFTVAPTAGTNIQVHCFGY